MHCVQKGHNYRDKVDHQCIDTVQSCGGAFSLSHSPDLSVCSRCHGDHLKGTLHCCQPWPCSQCPVKKQDCLLALTEVTQLCGMGLGEVRGGL